MRSDNAIGPSRTGVRVVKKPSYVVDQSRLQRFDVRNTVFERITWDSSWKGHKQMYDERLLDTVAEGKCGYSRVDVALTCASWIVHDAFEGGFSWKKIEIQRTPRGSLGIDWTKTTCEVNDTRKMSVCVKRAARLFGASLIGICKLNRDWLYTGIEIPDEFQNVIVMAIEMDLDGIGTSPTALAAAATGVGYSKMAFTLASMGEFIRNLGYEAIQCGNDTALSVPIAIDAGLGELGRNGLLITPQYGPRVRLCKIFTNLPLQLDKPIEFGVKGSCKKCKLCAKHCEAHAISVEDDPSFTVICQSNNPGALKWYVDAEKCYLYWCENGTDCSTCIKVCPYNIASGRKTDLSSKEFWGT
ncbi:MAG: reductive dehalogenase [Candidatus Bathyarchaeota archaeon]|nr:MAG: reductive dehalogenase [Candidatus Bathyarchaeota archaeon]